MVARAGGRPAARRAPAVYFEDSTIATTAFRSASLAATFGWSSVPPVLSRVTSFASAPVLPLYFSATDAHDGAFLVVTAVWHLLHFSLAMMSSAGPAKAVPAKASVAKPAARARGNLISVSPGEP